MGPWLVQALSHPRCSICIRTAFSTGVPGVHSEYSVAKELQMGPWLVQALSHPRCSICIRTAFSTGVPGVHSEYSVAKELQMGPWLVQASLTSSMLYLYQDSLLDGRTWGAF